METKHKSAFIEVVEKACHKKWDLLQDSWAKYAVRSLFGGIFLTMSTAAGAFAADKINTLHPSLGKFVFAFIFAFGLAYILFLNAELATSNMMYLSAGTYLKKIDWKRALTILLVCSFFNLVGALAIGWLFGHSGAFSHMDANSFITTTVESKLARTSGQIFLEGILANTFVNVAILSYALVKDQAAKLTLVISAIFMFVFLGNEHVVANFASFSISMFSPYHAQGMEFFNVLRQWFFAYIGNCVGGGVIIGLAYAWLNTTKSSYVEL